MESITKGTERNRKLNKCFLPSGTFRQIEWWVKFTNNYETKQTIVNAVNVVQSDVENEQRTHLIREKGKTENQSSKKNITFSKFPSQQF